MHRALPPVAALAVVVAALPAQTSTGDVGVTGFSTSQFTVLAAGSGTATPYAVGSFGGSGTSQSILWDPSNPQDFLVGGFGFIGRATVTGAGTTTYTPLTTSIGTASQMSFDSGGQIVVADAGTDQMRRVDPVTGVISPVTSGPQPWGTNLNAGFIDAAGGGAVYVGGRGSIHVVNPGGTQLFATGFGNNFVSGIVRDPFSTDVVATILTVGRVVRIDMAGNLTDLVPPGTLTSPNSIAVDELGDFVVGSSGGAVHRIPNAGGGATPVGTATGQGASASGVAVVGGLSAGVGPVLHSLTLSSSGAGDLQITVGGLPASVTEGWLLPSGNVVLPPGFGGFLGITPDQLTFDVFFAFPVAVAGFPLHWLDAGPGVFPHVPFQLPPGTTTALTGVTWDWVSVSVDPAFNVVTQSNVVRHTF